MGEIDYVRVLRRRWPVIAVCALLVAIGAAVTAPAAATIEAQQTFTATHTLYRDPSEPVPTGGGVSLQTVALLTTTGEIPRRVVTELGLSEDPAILASQVTVNANAEVGTVQIAYTSRDGDQAVQIADAFANQALQFFDERAQLRQAQSVDRLSATLSGLEERIRNLDAELAVLSPEPLNPLTGQPPVDEPVEAELVRAERDALIRSYGISVEQFEQVSRDQNLGSGLVTLQAATAIPQTTGGFTVPSNRGSRFALGLVVGAMAGIALAVFLERADDRLRGREEVEDVLDWPVIAEIPKIASEPFEIVATTRPASFAAEAYRIVRLGIQMAPLGQTVDGDRRTPVILFTSAGAAESKSTLVANVAASFAEVGQRVLVIDVDFRNAQQHKFFNTSRSPGLSDYLTAGERSFPLNALLQGGRVDGVQLIANGTVTQNPGQLLRPGNDVLAEARRLADIVLVDAGPALAVNEPGTLMADVDGVVVSARIGTTGREDARRLNSLLTRLQAPVLGVVLSAVPRSESGTPYYAQLRSIPSASGLRR